MISLTLAEITKALNAEVINCEYADEVSISNVSTDSRNILVNTLFIALKGERFDGHDYADIAFNNGAVALVVERPLALNLPQIIVKDCHQGLGQLGALVRDNLAPFCLALTGSNGKTSVKEMVATIIGQQHQVLYTSGNFNNDIGVPLTLLRLSQGDEFGVFELGANHLGEINYTSSLVRPKVALVNNVASAHLEGFGSLDGVAKAKLEIFNHLDPQGTAIINTDDHYASMMLEATSHYNHITFGIDNPANVKASELKADDLGCFSFTMTIEHKSYFVCLPLAGKHQVANALAATAMCLAAGFSPEEIIKGLASIKPVKGRMQPHRLGRLLIVDDTYNANPASVGVAIDWLEKMNGQRILVLGNLAELGENASLLHSQLGAMAKRRGIDALFCLGDLSQSASQAFGCEHYVELDILVQQLIRQINRVPGSVTVLVKGSRSSSMERVVEALNAAYGRGELV